MASDRQRWLFYFMSPIVAELLIFLTLRLTLPQDQFLHHVQLNLMYLVLPTGKETLIPLGIIEYNLNPVLTVIMIGQMDIIWAVFLLHNIEYAKKIPILGEWMRKLDQKDRKMFTRHRILGKLAFATTVFFVFLPFQGSGGNGGTIFGRALGLGGKTTVLAVCIGAALGSIAMGLFSDLIQKIFPPEVLSIVLAVLIIVLIAFAVLRLAWGFIARKKASRRHKEA